jgi:hypothetical protein
MLDNVILRLLGLSPRGSNHAHTRMLDNVILRLLGLSLGGHPTPSPGKAQDLCVSWQ